MVTLDAAQERNFREALAVTSDGAQQLRLAFAVWTESRGYNYANDGRNTSNSPGVTAPIVAILRGSLDIPHDLVGSNGRSTGILQQTSSNVGGVWGSMVGTMQPATAAQRFLGALRVTDDPTYTGTLLTPTGSKKVTVNLSDPVAADVLRVQQPLADEATSSNYDASQVAIARQIVAQLAPPTQGDWFMANNWDEARAEVQALLDARLDRLEQKLLSIIGDKMPVSQSTGQAMTVVQMLEYVDGHASAIDAATGPGPSKVDGSPLTAGEAARWADKHASDAAAIVQKLLDAQGGK
jgi:hypothetical protein